MANHVANHDRRAPVTVKRARDFLSQLALCGNVSEACRQSGVDRRHAYSWRKQDTAFASAWDNALNIAYDGLELEAHRRAVSGWDEPVYSQGEQVGVIRKYSDQLLMFLLRGARPEKYQKNIALRSRIEPTIPLIPSPETADVLDRLLAHIEDDPAQIEAMTRLLLTNAPGYLGDAHLN